MEWWIQLYYTANQLALQRLPYSTVRQLVNTDDASPLKNGQGLDAMIAEGAPDPLKTLFSSLTGLCRNPYVLAQESVRARRSTD